MDLRRCSFLTENFVSHRLRTTTLQKLAWTCAVRVVVLEEWKISFVSFVFIDDFNDSLSLSLSSDAARNNRASVDALRRETMPEVVLCGNPLLSALEADDDDESKSDTLHQKKKKRRVGEVAVNQ